MWYVRIEEQFKAYLDTNGEKLSDKEIKEAKENFYKGILNTHHLSMKYILMISLKAYPPH